MNYPTWQLKKSKHFPYLTTGRYKIHREVTGSGAAPWHLAARAPKRVCSHQGHRNMPRTSASHGQPARWSSQENCSWEVGNTPKLIVLKYCKIIGIWPVFDGYVGYQNQRSFLLPKARTGCIVTRFAVYDLPILLASQSWRQSIWNQFWSKPNICDLWQTLLRLYCIMFASSLLMSCLLGHSRYTPFTHVFVKHTTAICY